MICPNLNNPQVREQFNHLTKNYGENLSYYLWNKYNGEVPQFTAAELNDILPKRMNADEAKSYLESKGIPVTVYDDMLQIGNAVAHGYVANSAVNLWRNATEGTQYHEEFHYVFRHIMNDAAREQIYKAAEEEYGIPSKKDIERAKRGQAGISEQDAYNLALEEKLAEEYKVYQITDEESGKGLKAAIRNFFKRLHNFIKTVMRGDVDVQSIYYMIDQQNIPKKFVRGESSMRPQGIAYELKEPVVDRRSQTHADLRTTIANHFNDKFIEMRESSEFENLSDKEIAMLLAGTSSNNRGLVARKILHDSISYLDDTRLSEEDLLIVERAFSTGDLTELREKLSEDQKYKFKFSVPKDGVYPELDKQSPAERVRVGKLFFQVFSDWIPKFTTERDNPLGLPLYNIVPTENGGISMGWRQEMADTLKQIGYKISFRTVDAAKIEDEFDALEEYNKQVAYDKIYSMSEFENDPTLRAADEIRKMLAKLPNPQKNSLHVVNGLSYDSLHKLAIVALAGAESMEEIVERLQKRANTYQELKPLIRALSGEPDENGVRPWTDQDRALFKTLALEYTTKALMNERYVDKNVKRVVIINSDRRSVGLAHKSKWEETNVGYGKEALGTWLNKLSEDELSEGDRKYVTKDIVADMEVNGVVKSLPLSKRVDILYKEMLKISGTDEEAYKDRIEYMSRILWEMGIRFGDNVEVMIQGMLDHLEDNYGKFTKETFQTFSTKDFKFYSILKSVFDVETPAGKSRNILSIKGTKEQAVNVFDVYGSSFRFLGETVASKVDNQVAVSYIDGMGKLIWPFNMGSHRTFLFKHWVNGDEFFEQFKNDEAFNGFGMYQSTLLRLGMSKNFEIVTFDFDVFKSEDDDIADDGASGKTLSPRHQMMVEINAYLNSGEDFAYYPIPTQGTRNKVTFIKLPRFTSANSMNAAGLDASTISFEEHLRNIIIQDLIRISRDESAAVPPPRLRLMNLSGLEEELFETVEDDEGNTITRVKKEYHINGSPITNYMNEFNLVMFTMGDIGDESDPIYLRNKEINQKILALVTQLANHYIENVYPSIFEAVKKEALDYNLYQFDEVTDLEGYTPLKAGQKMSEQTFEKVLEEDSGLIFLTEEEGKNWTKEWKDPSEGTPLRFSRYLGKSNKYLLMTYEGKEIDNEGRTLYKLSYEKASPEEMPQTTALKGNLLDSVGLDKIATGSPEERFEVALDKYVKDSIIAIIELSKMLKGGRQHYKDDAAFFKRMEVFGTPGSTAYYKDESLSGNYGMSREYNESTISEFTTSDPEHDNIARRVYDELINNGVELSEAKRISDALYAMGVDSADGQRIISEDFYVDLVNGYYGELTEEQTEQYRQYRDGVPGVKNPIKYHRPLKMIYVGIRDTSKRGGLGGNVGVAPEDDKSSDVVISKELAAMSPTLQDMYDRMHLKGRYEGAVDPETNEPLEPIHVITQPTVKKGRKDTVFTYQSVTRDENGVPVETRADLMTLNNKYINKQLTKHLRMVQTINESKSNVSTIAKQFRKNTLAGLILNGNENYYLNRGFESFNPETDILSGKELHDLNQAATSQIMINALAELKKDLGYADLEDAMAFGNEEAINKARLFFLQRIRDILYEEKFEKGFMDENMSKQLKIIVDESGYSDFVMSLSFPVYEKSYQSILFSLFKNRVYKLKTRGKELVQVADFGKIYRDPVTGENRELRFTDVQQDALGSLVGAAEVMISWDVAEQYGLKPGDDLSQIPEELRRVISYRVPHQGKSSTFVGTIVGILPKSYKKTIVVPGNITVVMGSDFDVDKMFVMFPELIKSAQEDPEALEIFNNLEERLEISQEEASELKDQARQIVDSDIEAARVLYAYVNELREPHSMPAFTRWLIEREGVENILNSFVVETRRAPSVRSLEEIPGASLQSLRNTFFDTVEAVATSTLHLKESVEPLVTTPIENFILNEMGTNWDSTLPFESPLNNILVSERARDSASLIGTWANSLSGMAIISSLEDGLPMDTRVAFPIMGQVATRLNMFSETTGNSVSDLIKMRLSGALDYANTPFPTAVNENRFTFNMKMFIDVQTGDHRYADLIASTPLVKEFVRLRRIEGLKPRQAFIKVLESAGVDDATDMVDEAAAGMSKALKEVPYSKIMDVYKNNDSTSSEAKAIFMTAMVSHYAGQSLMNLFDGISTDSAEEYGDIAMMQAQGSTTKDYLNGTNVKIFGTDAVEKILVGEVDENGVRQFPYKTHATYFAIAQESLKMTSEFLMSAYESVAVFKDALSELTGNYGYGPKTHRMINRALAYMLMTQEGSPVNTLLTRDNIDRLYTNKKTKLSNELRELQRIVPALRNNSLFRQLQTNEVVSGLETIIIDTVKNQDSDASRADMIAAFSRMMYHPEIYTNNAELQTRIEQFAKDLVINSLVTSAAAPSYGSYYTYIPFEYWMGLTGKDGVTMSEFMRTELRKAKADPKYFEQFMFEFIRTYGTRNPDKRRGIVQLRNWRLSRKGEEAEQFREIRDQIEQKLLKDAREKYEVTSNDKLKKSVLANISRKAISFANNMAPISVSVKEMGFEETDDGFAMVENMPMLVGIRNKDNRENPITIYMRSDKKANGDFVYIPVQSKGFGSKFYETGIVDSEGQLETSSIASYFKAIPNNLAVTLTEVVSNSVSNSVDLGIEARRAFIKPASDLLTQKCK